MANFMGPMAPPQAAPQTPPQLDIRTNPGQRAQFKEFMQGMSRPAAPPTTAPIAPMLPAPTPMDDIDIFAPAPMADGGVVGGLQDLGKMSGQMVEALNTVVYGGGQGGGFGDSMSAGGGFGGGNMPPPLPSIAPPMSTGVTDQGPMNNPNSRLEPSVGLPFAQPLQQPMRMSAQDAYAQAQADARRQREGGFMGRVMLPGEMSFDDFAEGYNYRLNNPMQPLQTFADGGLADPFDRPSPKMVGGTTNVIAASANNTGGGDSSDPISSMDLYDVAMANPPLPVTGTPALISALDASMGMHNQRTDAAMDRMSAIGDALRSSTPVAKMRDFASGILGATQMDGPMGGTFGIRPVARDGNLGIMANFTVPFEDGGPVRMRRGGTTFRTGSDGRTVISSDNIVRDDGMTDRERAGADPFDRPSDYQVYDSGNQDDGGSDDGQSAAEIIAQMDAASENFDPGPGSVLVGTSLPDSVLTDETSAPYLSEFKRTEPFTDAEIQRGVEGVMSNLGISPVSPVAAPTMDVIDPMTDLLAGEPGTSGAGDDSLSAALNRLYATPITNMRSGEQRSAAEDLYMRTGRADMPTDSGGGFMGLGKMAVDALLGIGKGRAGKIADNIEMGRPAVIDSRSGQITGYVGDGLFGIGKAYTGRSGFNPFAPGANYTFDPSRNAYVVDYQQPNQGEDDQQRNRALPQQVAPPVTDSTPADPPVVVEPVAPSPRPDPMNVVVPSTRVADPLGLTPPAFAPVQSVGLPQSFLDLLASFNRPAPVAMQDGGAVLDRAADNFLEALKVA